MSEELHELQELYEHHRFIPDPGQQPLRIDKFLADKLPQTSRTRIQSAALAGNILVNRQAVKPNYKVKPGDVILIVLPHPPRDPEIIPEDIPLDIVYEDDHLMVLHKPAGMVVHPGHGNYSGTLVHALSWHLKDLPLFQSGEMRPGLVHRIDKNTSGLLVVGKNELALNHLARQFYEHSTDRRYVALAWGVPQPSEGTITGHIDRSLKDRKVMQVFPDGSRGKEAITHYRVLEPLSYVSLVECRLETGRTHQIRVHLKHRGHPLFNDPEYGGDRILRGTTFSKYKQFIQNCFNALPRQALHARSLSFDHPLSGERMHFESDLPEDMATVLRKWRTYLGGRSPEDGKA